MNVTTVNKIKQDITLNFIVKDKLLKDKKVCRTRLAINNVADLEH
jgi:hypothetical protein